MTAKEALKTYFGYDEFRPLQEEIVESVLNGHDTLALMPTGGGKSLCFQVPTMAINGLCLVISPLIALMKDQVENLKHRDIRAAAIYTGMTYDKQKTALDNCRWGPYHFLYVSPERLESKEFREQLAKLPITLIAVDEAHCISQWGYDFRPSYLKIAEIREVIKAYPRPLPEGKGVSSPNSSQSNKEWTNEEEKSFPLGEDLGEAHIPILALTATATPEVVDDIQEKLGFCTKNILRKSFARKNISYVVRQTDKKTEEILHILTRVEGSAIVYVRNRQRTQELAQYLQDHGISADFYHAGLSAKERSEKQEKWKIYGTSSNKEGTRVIVATNAFGMGIDKGDVRVVLHHDLPDTIEAYFQEAGRAGRDEKTAFAVLLYDPPKDKAKARKRVADNYPEQEFIHKVYHKTSNYLGVGADSGQGATFFLDIYDLCQKMQLPILPTYSALHLLDQMGYIRFQEEQDIRPRVQIRLQRRDIEAYNLTDKQSALLEILMRDYTGIFTELQYIHQLDSMAVRIAQQTNQSIKKIDTHQLLVSLAQKRIIDYVPPTRANILRFVVNRQAEIRINETLYQGRKQHYSNKLQAMVEYADNHLYCRSQLLLSYFGENDANTCGTCDICRANTQH